jgi:hypothetical protein
MRKTREEITAYVSETEEPSPRLLFDLDSICSLGDMMESGYLVFQLKRIFSNEYEAHELIKIPLAVYIAPMHHILEVDSDLEKSSRKF